MSVFVYFVAFILCSWSVASASDFGHRLLVLTDSNLVKETHSIFLKDLKDRGFEVTVKMADDSSLAIKDYGDYLFDHILMFAPRVKEFGGKLTADDFAQFVDDGGNMLIAASNQLDNPMKELGALFGVEFDDEGTSIIDHFNFDAKLDDGEHTTLAVNPKALAIQNAEIITGPLSGLNPLLFKGVGITADPENPLVLNILRGSASSYGFIPFEPVNEFPLVIGSSTLLIAGMQARNNARVLLTGSIEFFSNAFFKAEVSPTPFSGLSASPKSGNEQFARTLSQWVFKERGVLRARDIVHHRKGEKAAPHAYTITDDAEYHVILEKHENGKWSPFTGKDVQLEFVRIDPFVRVYMKANGKSGKYSASFKIPDVYGVYQFKIEYNRIGWTYLKTSTQVSVHPLRHTDFERFIPSAYPYYASAFSMMIGLLLFGFVFLYHRDEREKTE